MLLFPAWCLSLGCSCEAQALGQVGLDACIDTLVPGVLFYSRQAEVVEQTG
jgi:hypothetical protein